MATNYYLLKNTSGEWVHGRMVFVNSSPVLLSETTITPNTCRRYTRTNGNSIYVGIMEKTTENWLVQQMLITKLSKDAIGTPYASIQEFKDTTRELFEENIGVCNSCVPASLSDTVDLPHYGYIQPRLLAGNIKVTDLDGNVSTLAFDLKELSLFQVKRVWSTGTTSNMGIVVYY